MSFVQYLTTLAESLRFITISDLLDIVILSYVVYKGINILQRTNAAKVAKALLLILVVMWLSYQFNLNTINFVLSKAVELGLLALVIIFQPEIRRFLERIGSNNVSRIFRNDAPVSELETAINETVEAYGEMSKNKVGALMVFERDTDLANVISSGTAFQSSVTSELLKNLFFPKAPLHDGAVVAIVSEETGAISVAIRGNLRRHLSPETLGRVLRNELLPREQEPSKLRKKTGWLWQGR